MRSLVRLLRVVSGCALIALPARATPPLASDALPGVERTGFATRLAEAPITGALTLGYGFTEAQGDRDSAHHRQVARLAVGVAPSDWFAASLRLGQRYDVHPDDGTGSSDDGSVFEPRLAARFSFGLSSTLRVGPEFAVWSPGSEDLSASLEAATLDSRLLATLHDEQLVAGAALGYRLDNTANVGENADRLRPGDRLALGLSDFDALLLAVGASYDLGSVVLKGELSADLLIGEGAPPLSQSPVRVTAGGLVPLSRAFALDLSAEVSPSARPELGPGAPLIPIEPRVLALVGLRYSLVRSEPVAAVAAPKPTTAPAAPLPPEPAKPTTVPLEVELSDEEGQPVVGARVTLEVDGNTHELVPDGDGRYRLEAAPIGSGTGKLRAEGEGIRPIEQELALSADAPLKVAAKAPVALPSAQVRGLVRSFKGKPLAATVRLEPGGKEARTDDKGLFIIDVEPGEYQVRIEAEGYETQRRTITVQKQGVVVLNADLLQARKTP